MTSFSAFLESIGHGEGVGVKDQVAGVGHDRRCDSQCLPSRRPERWEGWIGRYNLVGSRESKRPVWILLATIGIIAFGGWNRGGAISVKFHVRCLGIEVFNTFGCVKAHTNGAKLRFFGRNLASELQMGNRLPEELL